jgi:hypothetical protein
LVQGGARTALYYEAVRHERENSNARGKNSILPKEMNVNPLLPGLSFTDKKENQIFLIYKEIQSGAVAKSYMRKGFLIYEEMGKYFPIYEEAVSHI